MTDLMTIREAAAKGIDKLRRPNWANADDYLKIDILDDGTAGPWFHLYSPLNEEINGHNPVNMVGVLSGGYDDQIWEAHE